MMNIPQYYQGCINYPPYRLRVEGKGSILVQPDTANVSIGVITENKELTTAQSENARILTNVINSIKSMGIPSEDIKTQSYIISPQYKYVDGESTLNGYRVVHTLSITIRDINKVGKIVDEAVEAGANSINSISFTVSNSSKYYKQALAYAIEDSKAKAVAVGKKLGVNMSQIPVRISEKSYDIPPIREPRVLSLSAEAATPIQPGEIEITSHIEAIFTYVPLL